MLRGVQHAWRQSSSLKPHGKVREGGRLALLCSAAPAPVPVSTYSLLASFPGHMGVGNVNWYLRTYKIELLHEGFNPHKSTLGTEGSVNWSRVQPKAN